MKIETTHDTMVSMLNSLGIEGQQRSDILAGKAALEVQVTAKTPRARTRAELANDPEAQADHLIGTINLVKNGAISRRPDETVEAFVDRIVAGDYDDPRGRTPDFGDAVAATLRGEPLPESYTPHPCASNGDDGFADQVVAAMRRLDFGGAPQPEPPRIRQGEDLPATSQLREDEDLGDAVVRAMRENADGGFGGSGRFRLIRPTLPPVTR